MINCDNFFIDIYTIEYLKNNSAVTKMITLIDKFIAIFFVAVFFVLNKILSFALFSFVFGIFSFIESTFMVLPQEFILIISLTTMIVKLLIKVVSMLLIVKWFVKVQTLFVYFKESVSKVDSSSVNSGAQLVAFKVNQKYNS